MRFSEDRLDQFLAANGEPLKVHVWEPARPKAVIVALHGGMAHGGDYMTPALFFKKKKFATVSYDLRGHGKYKKILLTQFEDLLDDTELFFDWVKNAYPGLPIIVMGHSTGALIATHFAIRRCPTDKQIKGFIFSSPYFKNAVKVSKLLLSVSGVLARLAPNMTVPLEDLTPYLTHDKTIYERHLADEADTIRASEVSIRFATELTKAQDWLSGNIQQWQYPLIAIVAGQDFLADAEATENLLQMIDQKWLSYHYCKENYHENFNELNRKAIFNCIDKWINEVCAFSVVAKQSVS